MSVHVCRQCLVSEFHSNFHRCCLSSSRRGWLLSLACEALLLGGQFILLSFSYDSILDIFFMDLIFAADYLVKKELASYLLFSVL